MNDAKTLLEVRNLKKYFAVPNGYLHAVDDVSFTIKEGETLGIVGESGCGKSTLGRVILRLHEPTDGKIIYNNMDITEFDKEEMRKMRQHMQIVFQDPYASLNPRFTIAQIIEEPLKLHNIYKTEAERRKRVEELMDLVGLAKRMYNMYPHEFDGGRRQRVVIARALSINPKFVVCDEPVSALDVSVQAQILNLLRILQKEKKLTYLFVSHDMSVIRHISDRILVMYLGQMMELADKKTLFSHPAHPYTKALMEAVPVPDPQVKDQCKVLAGEIPSPIHAPAGCPFCTRCPQAKEVCRREKPAQKEIEPGHFVACHLYSREETP